LLTQVVPFPPDSGPTVKIWNLIRIACRPATDLDDAIAAARRAPARCAPAGAA